MMDIVVTLRDHSGEGTGYRHTTPGFLLFIFIYCLNFLHPDPKNIKCI